MLQLPRKHPPLTFGACQTHARSLASTSKASGSSKFIGKEGCRPYRQRASSYSSANSVKEASERQHRNMSWGGPWGGQPQYPPQQYPQPQYPQTQGQYPSQYPQGQPNGGPAAPSAPPMPSAPWQQQPSPAQGQFPAGPGASGGAVAPNQDFGFAGPGAPNPYMPPPMPNTGQQPHIPQNFAPTGRKKALICACNYRGSPNELKGCINDAHCMKYLLTTRLGFREADIVMLTDDQNNPQAWPTRANMLYQMQMLTHACQPGDSLVFHFSGHGSQVRDTSGDEVDGLNETLCPCDFKNGGMIVDDELNRLLVNPLAPGVRLHAIIDACHSGTALDLEYRCKVKSSGLHWKMEYARRPSVYKGTAGGEALQIGAARDKQTAADTAAMSGGANTGAATFAFIQAIERRGTNISYGQLMYSMSEALEQLSDQQGKLPPKLPAQVGGLFGGLVNKLVDGAMDMAGLSAQTPVLSCNYPFDLNRPLAI